MDFSDFIDSIISLAKDNAVIAVILGLILLFLLFRKPKLFFGLLFLGLLVGGIFYLIMNIASSGSEQKERLLHKHEKKLENIR
ncbi:MAG: hypothetical protein ACM34I_08455 [bacterium]